MKLTLQDPHESRKREEIIVNGEKVGWAETLSPTEYCNRPRFHVGFRVLSGASGLIQGFGDTLEESVADAIARGRDEATQLLMGISRLEKLLNGE